MSNSNTASPSKHVRIQIDLPEQQAFALAQLAKRISWSEVRTCAVDEDEAYGMLYGMAGLQRALAVKGFSPR